MSVPYDYDRTNIEHLRAVVAEQEATIEYLREWFKEFESENAKLRELCADLYAEMLTYSNAPSYNANVWAPKLRELGVEVE